MDATNLLAQFDMTISIHAKKETDYQSNIERYLLSVLGLNKMLESF